MTTTDIHRRGSPRPTQRRDRVSPRRPVLLLRPPISLCPFGPIKRSYAPVMYSFRPPSHLSITGVESPRLPPSLVALHASRGDGRVDYRAQRRERKKEGERSVPLGRRRMTTVSDGGLRSGERPISIRQGRTIGRPVDPRNDRTPSVQEVVPWRRRQEWWRLRGECT